jgi:hypothetical protein
VEGLVQQLPALMTWLKDEIAAGHAPSSMQQLYDLLYVLRSSPAVRVH